jgi:hypothetical protein
VAAWQGGDWALQRSGAITLWGTESVTIDECEFTRIDGNGISINGYQRGLRITRNDFSWVGDSAMASWGLTGTCLNQNCSKTLAFPCGPDGRGGDQPWGTWVEANLVREIGIWQKQSSMWFQVGWSVHCDAVCGPQRRLSRGLSGEVDPRTRVACCVGWPAGDHRTNDPRQQRALQRAASWCAMHYAHSGYRTGTLCKGCSVQRTACNV